MNYGLLVVTHLLAFFAGLSSSWFWVVRKIRIQQVKGHPTLEYHPKPDHKETRV